MNENFPSNFYNLIKEHPCYLVPTSCSPDCQKCSHVSFAQAELCLIESLDECHRLFYRTLKYLLLDHILNSYQIKMASLHHAYVQKFKTPFADLGWNYLPSFHTTVVLSQKMEKEHKLIWIISQTRLILTYRRYHS